MRIQIVSATVILSLCGVPFSAAAQSICMKPWATADKWIDNHDETAPIDATWTFDDTFETVDAHGTPLLDADVYHPSSPSGPGTGFSLANDVGRRVWLKVSDGDIATQGWFFAVDIGGAGNGAEAYRTAITTCDPAASGFPAIGDELRVLKGNMRGPTIQGALDLIAQDPVAQWDDGLQDIVNSCALSLTPCAPVSPRIFTVAAFNPAVFEQSRLGSGTPRLIVSNVVGVFLEAYVAGYVVGVIVPIPQH